jgi:polyisoprenyl-teichoic acid--peptidoglycan teichoic acid transferase
LGEKINSILLRWKKLSRKKKLSTVIAVLLVFTFAGGAAGYFHWMKKAREVVVYNPDTGEFETRQEEASLNGRVNILLLGVDERKNSRDKTFRSDTIILASIDPSTQQISLLSIPRDTRVQIPKRGWDKINATAAYGGLNTTIGVVQQLTGVKIDGYIKTNFEGFKEIIDGLSGILVDVEKDMYYETGDTEDGTINLKKGEQVLDGSKALQYARFRHDANADITRTTRQQVVLKAVAKKLMEPSSILKIPVLAPKFIGAVETNLPGDDLLKLAKVTSKFDSSKVISRTLPGYFLNIDGISYWGIDPEKSKKVAADLLAGIVADNTFDELIKVSAESKNGGKDPVPQNPQPEVEIGSIGVKAKTSSSVTLSVTRSTGVSSAEVWRENITVSGNEKVKIKSWPGTAVTITDSGLAAEKEYTYVLKVYDSKGRLMQVTNPVFVTTSGNTTSQPPTPPTGKESDNTPPTFEVTGPLNNTSTNKSSVKVSGKAENGSTVKVNGSTVANNDGNFDTMVNLQVGSNTITVTVTDAAGNSAIPVSLIITRYKLKVTNPAENAVTQNNSISVSGIVEPGSTLKVQVGNDPSINGLADSEGNFSVVAANLVQGQNTITITAVDSIGTQSVVIRHVNYTPT